MYNLLQLSSKFLGYYFKSANSKGHGVHSPFVYHFIRNVLNDKTHYPEYDIVEKLRAELLNDQSIVQVQDLGAGSSSSNSTHRSIASIAKLAAKPKKFGQLLFRMVKTYKPDTIVELGTSLGITTSYLALAMPGGNIKTMEGATDIAVKASANFERLGLRNIEMTTGNFDETLIPVLDHTGVVDFAFVDGNHRKEPTLRYFEQLLAKTGNNSILVFDDIHWSREMEEAWDRIKSHPAVSCSIDLFFIGIIFFRKEFMEKQHFTIRF